jgi:G2/mitotic-specific cyclin 2
VQHTRVTRSKLASTTEITTSTTTALPSKVGNNNAAAAGTRKRAALGDVTNAHKKPALGDITNAVVKKDTEKPAIKRPVSRKPSAGNVKKPAESKPLASKQTIANNPSVVIPKKRSSEAVAAPAPPRRTLTQSTSTSSLTQKSNARVAPARRRVDEVSAEPEAPRKKQKVEVSPKPDWDDLDAVDANDPLMVSDYVVEIFNYLKELEVISICKIGLTAGKNDAKSIVHEKSSRP